MAKKTKWFDWVMSVLVGIALLNWGTVFWFDLNLVEVISFGVTWIMGTIYTIVSIVGLIWLINLVYQKFK